MVPANGHTSGYQAAGFEPLNGCAYVTIQISNISRREAQSIRQPPCREDKLQMMTMVSTEKASLTERPASTLPTTH